MPVSPKPIVLLLGEVLHAPDEWSALSSLAELRVSLNHNPAARLTSAFLCHSSGLLQVRKQVLTIIAANQDGRPGAVHA